MLAVMYTVSQELGCPSCRADTEIGHLSADITTPSDRLGYMVVRRYSEAVD